MAERPHSTKVEPFAEVMRTHEVSLVFTASDSLASLPGRLPTGLCPLPMPMSVGE
mgnify:CR=1 FL=1